MNEEFPDEGLAGGSQDPEAERAVSSAPPPSPATPSPTPAPGPLSAQLPPSGDDRVDAAVAGLRRLPALPPDEHVAVLEEVHGRLRDILGELSEDGT
ncbi:MAG: hypothetical protein WAK82_35135 [Streptosporangiaceae bacterium]